MNDSTEETKSEKVKRLAYELNRALLGRPDGADRQETAKQWLVQHVREEFPVLALTVQTVAICEMVEMFEVSSRAGLSVAASLLHQDKHSETEAIAIASELIHHAGQALMEQDQQTGPAH